MSTMKRPDFGHVLKIGKWFFSGIKDLLLTTPGSNSSLNF
jgi:hypothetical protein